MDRSPHSLWNWEKVQRISDQSHTRYYGILSPLKQLNAILLKTKHHKTQTLNLNFFAFWCTELWVGLVMVARGDRHVGALLDPTPSSQLSFPCFSSLLLFLTHQALVGISSWLTFVSILHTISRTPGMCSGQSDIASMNRRP